MKHIGIIVEYNPFHNGHAYQLQTIHARYPDKRILVILSGDFVQRGEPAIFNKYLRTQCALDAGVDVVFELPALFATSSAEYFATAAVCALAATGVVDTLCFGAETEDLSAFLRIAKLLVEEPEAYKKQLKENLKCGHTFPKARAMAVSSYFHDSACADFLRQPNNILGIEYIKAILKFDLAITPVPLKREGNGYHDLSISQPFSSASALRQQLRQTQDAQSSGISSVSVPSSLETLIPEATYALLRNREDAKPLFWSDFYPFLQYALWNPQYPLESYFDLSKELKGSLCALSCYPFNIETLIRQLACKNYTAPRIRRALLHLLLGHTKADMECFRQDESISYLRLLGFTSDASFLLRSIKTYGQLQVVNKVADYRTLLCNEDLAQFEKEIQISMLYRQAFFNHYGILLPSEYERSVIIRKKKHTIK